jgi:hypothetical protein
LGRFDGNAFSMGLKRSAESIQGRLLGILKDRETVYQHLQKNIYRRWIRESAAKAFPEERASTYVSWHVTLKMRHLPFDTYSVCALWYSQRYILLCLLTTPCIAYYSKHVRQWIEAKLRPEHKHLCCKVSRFSHHFSTSAPVPTIFQQKLSRRESKEIC